MMQQALKLLVIEQMKAINILSTKEPRVVKKEIVIDGVLVGLEEEDLRVSYLNAISSLTILLHGEFDSILNAYYNEHIIFLEGYGWEWIEKVKDKKFIEKLKDATDEKKKKDISLFYQMKEARAMYLQINLFLQRTNLLKMEDKE